MGSLSKEEAEGFFTDLGEKVEEKKEKGPRAARVESIENLGTVEHISRNMNWNEGVEKIIKQSMLIGNLEGAVDCCLKCGRTAEALILASFAGDELFTKTKEKFLETHSDPFLQTTFSHIISRNLSNLVDSKRLHEWKEILAYCVTYSNDGGKQLAMELGNELLQKRNDVDSAIICFIVANAFAPALDLWMRKLRHELGRTRHYKERAKLVHKTFEKSFVLRTITRSFEPNATFDELIIQYATSLANNAAKDLALKYLELANPNNPEVLRVKERIIGSNPRVFAKTHKLHTFPYPTIEVKVLMPLRGSMQPLPREEKKATPLYKTALSPVQPPKTSPEPRVPAALPRPALPPRGMPVPPNIPPQGRGIFVPTARTSETPPPQPPKVEERPPVRPTIPAPRPIQPPQFRPPPIRPFPGPPEPTRTTAPPVAPRSMYAPPPVAPSYTPPPAAPTYVHPPPVVPAVPSPVPAAHPVAPVVPPPVAAYPKAPSPPKRGILEQANFGIGPARKEDDGTVREDEEIDISRIPAEDAYIVQFFTQEADALAQVDPNPKKAADLENRSKVLYRRLINRELTPETLTVLKNCIQAIQSGNYPLANKYVTDLSGVSWERNKEWLQGLKRILQFRATQKR